MYGDQSLWQNTGWKTNTGMVNRVFKRIWWSWISTEKISMTGINEEEVQPYRKTDYTPMMIHTPSHIPMNSTHSLSSCYFCRQWFSSYVCFLLFFVIVSYPCDYINGFVTIDIHPICESPL